LRKVYWRYFRPDPIAELIKRGLVVGKNFSAQDEVIIDSSHCWHIVIGDDVTLAPRVHILAHDASTKLHLNYTKIGKVTIGDRVFIGAGSIVLPGVTIGDDVVIGAGSVVAKDIPRNSVAVGNPAHVVSSLDTFLARRKQEMNEYPCFGKEYTLAANPDEVMKIRMNQDMRERYGFII
jgi:maltose O-acetyltransferase